MVRTYKPQNRFVKGARPEVTEEGFAAMVFGTYELKPATVLSKQLGLSRVTVGKYYELIFDRLLIRVSDAVCREPLRLFETQLQAAESMKDDPGIQIILRVYAGKLPKLTYDLLNSVLEKAHEGLYRDKKGTRIVPHEEKVEHLGKKELSEWPDWLTKELEQIAVRGATDFLLSYLDPSGPVFSQAAHNMNRSFGLLTNVYAIGLAQTVTKVYLNREDLFRSYSKRHKSLSPLLFKRVFVRAFLESADAPSLFPWKHPTTLLHDFKNEPLDLTKPG